MNEINKENYQAWFLDYVEGSLSANGLKLLEDFLAAHPHLRAELEEFEELTLPGADAESMDWDVLKKPDLSSLRSDIHAREQLYFGAIEGQLNTSEQDLLSQLLASAEYAKEYANWQKTRLQPSSESMPHVDLYRFGLDRPVDEQNFEYYLIASSEGLLSESQESDLAIFAEATGERQKALKRSQMLRLQAPAGVFFPDKDKLYRKEETKILPLWWFRAATVALVVGLGWVVWNGLSKGPDLQPLAEKTEKEAGSAASDADTAVLITAPVDSVPEEKKAKVIKEPELEDWEVREPEPAMLAQEEKAESPAAAPVKSAQPTAHEALANAGEKPAMESLQGVQSRPLEVGMAERVRPELGTPDFIVPLPAEGIDIAEIAAPVSQNSKAPMYKSLPELAVKKISEQFDISEEERDMLALTLARKLTEQAGEALNTEFKKEKDSEGNSLTYTLRIGSLKVSHSRSR